MKWLKRCRATDLAFFRALEHERTAHRRLLADPYAKSFLPFHRKCLVWLSRLPLLRRSILCYLDIRWPGARSACIARTRLIDNMTLNAIRHGGVNQVMIIGGGYDCRPQRLQSGKQPFFIEVDHARLQHPKQKLLNRLKGKPDTVDYIPIDLHTQSPGEVVPPLVQQQHYKTLFICEAIPNLQAIRSTLQYIRQFPPGTRMIFTYIDHPTTHNPGMFFGVPTTAEDRIAGFRPEEVRTFLREFDMDLIYDVDAPTYRRHCFGTLSAPHKRQVAPRVALALVK